MSIHLGQHFLINKFAINKIVSALDIQPNETIIEIGPGRGELTFSLLEECVKKNGNLIAIEKDAALAQNLEFRIQNLEYKNVKNITGDALKELQKITQELKIKKLKFKIVGNIPYYITGKLLRVISELKNKPVLTVLMIQKEVAERITASPSQMNLLAAATQFWAKPEIILQLKPEDFDPPPEVNSAIIKLTTKIVIPANEPESRSKKRERLDSRFRGNDKTKNKNSAKETEKYYKLIRVIFKQPRKTLINNLKELNIEKNKLENIIKSLNLPLNCRPQDLSIENILKLLNDLKI